MRRHSEAIRLDKSLSNLIHVFLFLLPLNYVVLLSFRTISKK
jgi:hypothetical protein